MKRFFGLIILWGAVCFLSATSISETFSLNDVSLTMNSHGYYDVRYEGMGNTGEYGTPSLPALRKTFIIPPLQDVKSLTVTVDTIQVDGEYVVMPMQNPTDGAGFTPPDSILYGSND